MIDDGGTHEPFIFNDEDNWILLNHPTFSLCWGAEVGLLSGPGHDFSQVLVTNLPPRRSFPYKSKLFAQTTD
jgi:hypothetical protein